MRKATATISMTMNNLFSVEWLKSAIDLTNIQSTVSVSDSTVYDLQSIRMSPAFRPLVQHSTNGN